MARRLDGKPTAPRKGYIKDERFYRMRNIMRNLSHIGVPNRTFEVLCGWKHGRAENIRSGAQRSISEKDYLGFKLAEPYLIKVYQGLKGGFEQVGYSPRPYREITSVRGYRFKCCKNGDMEEWNE